jgi:outer membrane murein-binding lipoprotein Lpp
MLRIKRQNLREKYLLDQNRELVDEVRTLKAQVQRLVQEMYSLTEVFDTKIQSLEDELVEKDADLAAQILARQGLETVVSTLHSKVARLKVEAGV